MERLFDMADVLIMPVDSVNFCSRPKLVVCVLLVSLLVCMGRHSYAQLWTGGLGDPVVNVDFGSGSAAHGPALPVGITNYTHVDDDFPNEGSYTIENRTTGNIWRNITDHTGNTGGYMIVVNAATAKTDYFYQTTVTGLCPNTTFEFAAWITNLLKASDANPPNVTFTVINATLTSATYGQTLKTYATGAIPLNPNNITWKQYGTSFTTPADVSDVIIKITNNGDGGTPGNDLALDDITLRPCGPALAAHFDYNTSGAANSIEAGCAGSDETFKITSGIAAGVYTSPVYQWQVNTGSGWNNIAGAMGTTFDVNTLSAAPGFYYYRVVSSEATNSGSSNCQVASNLVTIKINPQATADFTADIDNSLSCLSKKVSFTDKSTPANQVTSWSWDFGDGQTSHLSSPIHTYSTYGKYTVKLTISSVAGCQSYTTQQVDITAKIVADFDVQSRVCPGQLVTFTDKSTSANGYTISQWIWSFGDGTKSETHYDKNSASHIYTNPGNYTATLELVSSTSCVSDVTPKTVVVAPVDIPVLKLPDACQADVVQFADSTHFADGNPGYTYLWNFGDAQATPGNDNISNLPNPQHHYSHAGNYTVSLTLTAPSGCSATTSRLFTVNGTNPIAGFTVSQPICAADSVTLTNTSTVDFGNITKLEIFWDYDGASTASSVYYRSANQIPSNNIFKHLYSVPTGQASKPYHIRLIASSGGVCGNTTDQTIQVFANPKITLKPLNAVCIESGKQQIVENKNGYTGTGVFSGRGVSSTGLFDPQVAGLGIDTIHYTFTSQIGCTYVDSLTISVYKSPAINLVTTATAFEGGSLKLNPTAVGDSLTYQWSPAAGVSNTSILNPSFSPTENTTYTLTVTTSGGCSGVAQVDISVIKKPVIPNAFTPNGDGVNDTWEIKYMNYYPNATIDVFNRNGAKVFTSIGYAVPWDGKLNGKSLPFGVYYYVINPKTGRSAITGSVTIIK